MESARGSGPVFWKELYGFTLLCLVGFIIALVVLPPRLQRYRSLQQLESELRERNARLDDYHSQVKAAIASMEGDPFYREGVYRQILGVRKKNEEFVDPLPGAGR